MLDRRAQLIPWLITALLFLLAAGAYTLWIIRPRAQIRARSLTAAPQTAAAQPITSKLHVEGCNDDFLIKPGELIEPKVLPGSSLDQFRAIYGIETSPSQPSSFTWQPNAYTLTASSTSPSSIHIALKQGHVLETLDGVELGIDSFATIFAKMRDKKVEVHERLQSSPAGWTLTVSLYSACSRKFRSEYTRTLPSTPETDRLIQRREPAPNGQPGLLRSDLFMNKVVSEYTLVPSNAHDDSIAGVPSTHD